jgi:Winged helix DNA-binding domain
MRSTLHVVSRDDYRHFLAALLPMFRTLRRRLGNDPPTVERVAELADASRAFASVPRSNTELRDHATSLDPEIARDVAWWFIRRYAAFVNVPSDVTWSFGRRPMYVDAAVWLDGAAIAEDADALARLARRYLGAFGPATLADAAAWSGLPIARLRPGFAALDAAGGLVRFADDLGRELLDLADAPRPAGDAPTPPRLLPMWDSLLLAYADRTRVISDEHRRIVVARNGDTLPTFLVDGRVAGLWWAEADGSTTRVVLEPFGRLAREERLALELEGESLAAFVGPHEPDVYRRYRWTRARER